MGNKLNKRDTWIFGLVFIVSLILFNSVRFYDKYLYIVFKVKTYITLHLLLEMLSIVMSSAVFFITLYTFEKTHKKKSVIIACTFLAVSLLDMFHTLSYNGMPVFLNESSVGKATNFWIAARLSGTIGLLYACLVSAEREIKFHVQLPLFLTILYCLVILYVVTYKPEILPRLFIEGQGLTPLKIFLEYLLIIIQMITMILFIRSYFREKDRAGYLYLIIAMLTGVFSEMSFTLYSNVYDTYNLLGHIYKIISYYLLFKALFVLNVQKPYHIINEAERQISVYADNLENLVKTRTREIQEANDKLMKNLGYARNIQAALLPLVFPKNNGLNFSSRYIPCEIIGGDFYNVYKLDEDNIGILIGDVAGHGVSAAMVTVFIHQNIKVKHEYDDGRVKILTPKQVVTNLYYAYNRMSFPDEVYTVLFYCIYNLRQGELVYCSAGMNTNPMILNKQGEVKKLDIHGMPICNLGEYVNPSYENSTIKCSVGDIMIFYTDGLFEIDRKNPVLFTEEDIVEYIKGMRDASEEDVCEALLDVYYAMRGDRKMIDDVTVLVAKCKAVS